MATQGERRALIFLASVALLGAGTRAWRGRHVAVDASELSQQIQAVDDRKPEPRASARRRKPVDSVLPAPRSHPVDIDTASAAEIEKLPGIGPALAGRIIKDREEKGPFGCLAVLDRVKGVGPALLAKIDSLATFSAARGAQCESKTLLPKGSRRR
jgi:competence protein ComEA